jgi:hypothetical protein
MRRHCRSLLVALAVGSVCVPAAGQQAPWSFAAWGNPAANGSANPLADYVATGQTPHPAVVRIVAAERAGASLGSGVLVDVNRSQGLVLTNWHVVRDSRSAVLVQFPDGFQTAGTVIRWDEPWDLAAVAIWKPAAQPIPLAAAPPAPGDSLTIAGFGRGPYRAETGRCTEYLAPGSGYPREFVELLATARQGDSGGPILNDRGELAGVLFGESSGRTIGSCSTRVKTFLASVGSRGFTPMPIAEFSAARAVDRSPGEPDRAARTRIAQVSDDGPLTRSSHVAGVPAAGAMPPLFVPAATGAGDPFDQLGGPGGVPPQTPPQFAQFGQAAAAQPPFPAEPSFAQPAFPAAADAPQPSAGMRPTDAILPSPAELAAVLDVRTNGQSLLSAGGGMAMMILGLRTMFGGRRSPAARL